MNLVLKSLLRNYPDLVPCQSAIQAAYELLEATFERGGKLLTCGNGGSASDSDHLVGELMKEFLLPRPLPSHVRSQLVAAFSEEGHYLWLDLTSVAQNVWRVSRKRRPKDLKSSVRFAFRRPTVPMEHFLDSQRLL